MIKNTEIIEYLKMSVETLYIIFGVLIILFVFLALIGRRNNPHFNVGLAMACGVLISIFIIYSLVYFYGIQDDLEVIFWIAVGLIFFFLLWGLIEHVKVRKSQEHKDEKKRFSFLNFTCKGDVCELSSVGEVDETPKGESITTYAFSEPEDNEGSLKLLTQSSFDDSDIPFSSIGDMKIKYLV